MQVCNGLTKGAEPQCFTNFPDVKPQVFTNVPGDFKIFFTY